MAFKQKLVGKKIRKTENLHIMDIKVVYKYKRRELKNNRRISYKKPGK